MAAGLRWLFNAFYWLLVVLYLLGGVWGTFQWVLERTRQYRFRGPEWLGFVGYWLWVGWGAFLAQLLAPQVFDPSALLEASSGREGWWLLPALIWAVAGLGAPAALLFAVRWTLARFQRKQRERKRDRSLPWQKFDPIGHRLNWKQVFTIPAVVIGASGEPMTTTVGKVINEILPGRFNMPGEPEGQEAPIPDSKEYMGSITVEAPDGRTVRVESIRGHVRSARFAAELVDGILKLFRITEDVHDCLLFFYEYDHWYHMETNGERFKFFVVHGDKIVLEDFELSSLCNDFFDHTVLKSMYEKEEWQKEEWEKGVAVEDDGELTQDQTNFQGWWYRRFYTETTTGQMKVFWNELLYNYVPPEQLEAERDKRLTARLRRVERVVLGIAGLLVAHYVFKWF